MAQERFLGEHWMPDIAEQWRVYLRTLGLRRGDRVLDVGCHEGDAIAFLLAEYPEVAHVIGLDRNLHKVEHAQRRFATDHRVEVVHGDAVLAPFGNEAFDRIYCVDMLEWASDPTAALREIRRMLAPGGVALAIHTDFDTQVFASDELELTRRIVHAFTDQGRRGTIGRELFGLCASAGFAHVEPSVWTLVGTTFDAELYPRKIARMMRTWLVEKGGFDAEVFDGWVRGLEERDSEQRFFYSVNRNICVCTG